MWYSYNWDKRNQELALTLRSTLASLTKLLPSYAQASSPVCVMHKRHHPEAQPQERYLEIDQAALKQFIDSEIPELTEQKAVKFSTLYNVQFRLEVYQELITEVQAMINYFKLQEELLWAAELITSAHELEASSQTSFKAS